MPELVLTGNEELVNLTPSFPFSPIFLGVKKHFVWLASYIRMLLTASV